MLVHCRGLYTKSLLKSSLAIFLFLLSANVACAQTSRVTISFSNLGQINVDAALSTAMRSWSFRNAYVGVLGIAERIDDFRATSDSGQDARAKKIATGEFRSDLDATRITYKVRVSEINAA